MQERITKRVGRFVRLLAGRPPVVPTDSRGRRDSDFLALRPDSAVRPLAVGNALAPSPSPAAGPPAAASTLPLPAKPAARPPAAPSAPAPPASKSAPPANLAARPTHRGRLTASAALLGMLLLCLVTCLVAAWRQLDVLAGFGFCASCVLAPVYARRAAQLKVAVSAPVVFLVAEIIAQSLTAPGSSGHGTLVSILEGTLLALADLAPWLFAGTALCIVIAMFRGLPQCLRDLRTGDAVRSAGRAGLRVPGNAAPRGQRSQRG